MAFAVPRSVRASASGVSGTHHAPQSAAPHVVAHIETACGGDRAMAARIADVLSPAQRRGLSALPDPLPLVPAIHDGSGILADPRDRLILLTAAVCVDDRVDVLLEACGIPMGQLIASRAASALSLVAGRFGYADQRTRILVHGTADLSERTIVHRRLERTYRARGESEAALWHRALSTMEGESALTPSLLHLAERALIDGDPVRAYAVAREAASHADAATIDAARILAGRAALSGGWLDDAIAWLSPVIGAPGAGNAATGALGLAMTLRHGSTPSSRRGWADEQEATFLSGCWSREVSADQTATPSPLRAALRAALRGEIDEGLALLAEADAEHPDRTASQTLAPGPLLRAHRDVLTALLRTWRGDLGEALAGLRSAAASAPAALPYRGLAVRLARRLELAVDGRSGELSAALDAASPLPHSHDRLMERGIAAYLSGRSNEAAVHLRLCAERSSGAQDIGLPGLDEAGPLDVPLPVEPPDLTRARDLRRRIRRADALAHVLDTAAEEARAVRSPFERGRVEAMLGIAGLTRGDRAGAAWHLRAAIGLLADAGADAWRCATEGRLARLGEQPNVDVSTPTTPIPGVVSDPLAACRAAWQPVLTGRELQIAMLIAEGAANRVIAERLHVSVRTIEVHAGRIFRKFEVRSRGELTALAHRTNQHV
ncbi:LuxR C-terminal-related transcriptional regulator [Microbacterium sp. NPDC058342]|uniref:LuxR C-terminal-related transcriptional regulator n=1 Tax=Microbacterium sp. NPDC058342 TaxID=3346454 RepID=UPI0036671585